MTQLTYEQVTKFTVKLEGKVIGEIKVFPKHFGEYFPGYQYFPKGQKNGGEIFKSLPLCKASLEAE